MDKQEQEKYIKENIGFILQEYREKLPNVKNKIVILVNYGVVVSKLNAFKDAESFYYQIKDMIQKGDGVPVLGLDSELKPHLYRLKNE